MSGTVHRQLKIFLNCADNEDGMKHIILSLLLLFLITYPATAYAEEPLPREGFIKITEHLLNTLNVLEDHARNGNLDQLHNPVIQDKFDIVTATLQEYEHYASGTVHSWPEGQQKKIASELQLANFHYRAYSMNQNTDFRQSGEQSLQTVRDLFRDYRNRPNTSKKGYFEP
jgi:hypothetical protein